MIDKIKIREYQGVMRVGVRPKRRGLRDRPVTMGFDIETSVGRPYILGVSGDGLDEVCELEPGQGLVQLLQWIRRLAHAKAHRTKILVVGAHNLKFDLGVLFHDWCEAEGLPFPATADKMIAEIEGGTFMLWIGPVTFATYKFGHRTVHLIDTFAYFKTSLVRAVQQLGLGETKADFPGRHEIDWFMKRFPLAEIGPYCLQDAQLARLLVDQIVDWWMAFGIRPSISGPQMAGRVFCKEFVAAPWSPVPQSALILSLLAYHGGRNLFVGTPGWYPSLRSYDVNSAYTWAMTRMPDMTRGQWWWGVEGIPKGAWGFVVISGTLPRLKYPVLYQDDFTPIWEGPVDHLAITTMEWELFQELAPEFVPTEIGWLRWMPTDAEPSDLSLYAQEMWERRVQAGTDVEKTLYKFLSNSLYGKFIARSPRDPTPERPHAFVAGELFYPPVAAWITALVRCLVIRAEFENQVLHTATDGIMMQGTMPESAGLGGFKLENEGPALLFRNKLYLAWNKDGRLKKAATHGFQGYVDKNGRQQPAWKTLLTMLRDSSRTYPRKRLRGWKEARRDAARPFAPMELQMQLHLPEADWRRIVDQSNQEPYRSLIESSLA